MQFGRLGQFGGCAVVVLCFTGCEPGAAPPAADGGAQAGLQMAPPPPAGNFGNPAPEPAASPPPSSSAATTTPPAGAADNAGTPSTGKAAIDAYFAVEDEMYALLQTVTDADSARAAAPQLRDLATRIRPLVHPYWRALATLSSDEKVAMMQERGLKAMELEKSREVRISQVIELMKQPGGEELKAAFLEFLRASSDDAPRIPKESAQKRIAELQ